MGHELNGMLLKKHRRDRQPRLPIGSEDHRSTCEKCGIQSKGTDRPDIATQE